MKIVLSLIVAAIAFVVGYTIEPKIRYELTGKPENFVKTSAPAKAGVAPVVPAEPTVPTPPEVLIQPVEPTVPEVVEQPVTPTVPVTPIEPEVAVLEPTTPVEPIVPTEPEPVAPPVVSAGSGDVVAIMKSSIAAREIQEFSADQVLEWTAGQPETVDGASYETGNLTYQSETVFGTKNIQAKALIQSGKVVRWVWPKSGMEIK
jgi:hypothetical protein